MIRFRDFVNSRESKRPHYMVIGHPVGHSLSPLMHGVALRHYGLDRDYHAVDLDPSELSAFIAWINRDTFLGTNITIPYKKEFTDVVDRLDQTARAVGAINTIVKEEGRIAGYNTDVDGFRQPLEEYTSILEGGRAILFGSGGASMAVLYALEQLGIEETVVVSRNPGRLQKGAFTACNYRNWQVYAGEASILINSTPLGMAPETDRSVIAEEDVKLLEGRICYDLVYNPMETLFIKQAREAGAVVISGLEMFIGQGDRAFELWTGKRFPRERVTAAVKEKLRQE